MYKYMPHLITIILSFLGACGQIFFKKAVPLKLNIVGLLTNYWLFFGIFFYSLSLLGYLYVLKYAPVSKLYPIIAFSYIFVMFLSWIFLKEKITGWSFIGSIGIIISVYLIVK